MNQHQKDDPLVWDLAVLARRALRRATRAEQLRAKSRGKDGASQNRATQQTLLPPLPPRWGTFASSPDSLSVKHLSPGNPKTFNETTLQLGLGDSPTDATNRVASASSILDKLKGSPLYSNDFRVPSRRVIARRPPLAKPSKAFPPSLCPETTGPTNWSVVDLNRKYRDELLREKAYRASLEARGLKSKMEKDDVIISAVEIGRHPLLVSSHRQIQASNVLCLGRGRMRCVARRFVLDVHQIWLTNLDHLEAANRGTTSRHLRVDLDAILAVKSQIQSVAVQHSWRSGYLHAVAAAAHAAGGKVSSQRSSIVLEHNQENVTLVACEILFQGGVAYEASVVRRFWPGRDLPAKWLFCFYDPLTGMATTASTHEDAMLCHSPGKISENPSAKTRPLPAKRILVHTQGCLVRNTRSGSVAAICQVFVCTPHTDDPNQTVLFELVFLSCNRTLFQIWQTQLDALDIIAQLGLSHAPCTLVRWWCQRGHFDLFTSMINLFVWSSDALALGPPHESSALSWGFDFKSTANCALWLLGVLTVDTSQRGLERTANNKHPSENRHVASLSLCVSGVWDRLFELPGATAVGTIGLGFTVKDAYCRGLLPGQGHANLKIDRTNAVAILHRHDGKLFNRVAICLSQALDCVLFSPRHVSWDNANLNPPSVFRPPQTFTVPSLQCSHFDSCICTFKSLVTYKVSRCLLALTSMAYPADWDFGSTQAPHYRGAPRIDSCGFRVTTSCALLASAPSVAFRLFSFTQNGATPNKGALTGRNTRHSARLCTSVLSRTRIVEDYIHILHKNWHQGANDPGFYTIHLRHTSFHTLSRNDLAASKQQIRREEQRRESEEEERRLEEKIFQGKVILAKTRQFKSEPSCSNSLNVSEEDHTVNDNVTKSAAGNHVIQANKVVGDLANRLGLSHLHLAQCASGNLRFDADLKIPSHGCLDEPQAQELLVRHISDDELAQEQLALLPTNHSDSNQSDPGAWRRLHRGSRAKLNLQSSFAESHIQGAIDSMVNTASQPTIVGMIHPASGVDYKVPAFSITSDDCIFITEVLEATVRSLERQKGLTVDTEMSANDRLLAQSGKAAPANSDRFAELENTAFVRCKLGHTDGVEECLDQEVAIENRDEHGNTLVIISAQQNNKKMLKLLLRRGADINAQNSTGNTALHYANEYKFDALTEYILNKGGDDTILNMKGLTCYEGVGGTQ
mmetsp:Transcript_7720/g.24290  ORF Transcript_7720/g.24290 Transcript_7720/m.24290 type:complete len:1199 (+) Transcript_7720:59-3655(+)